MEVKINLFLQKIKDNKVYDKVTGILFPVLLVVFSLLKVNQGIDITDSTYSLSNFLFVKKLDGMWFFSTFYANLLGGLLIKLPFGNCLLAMNLYTGVFKAIIALLAYFFFAKYIKADKMLTFFGVLVSVGLCWCPTTILYNYLTYLLFFAGTMLLFIGLKNDNRWCLFFAGVSLGSNVFVRLPNLSETALIFSVFGFAFWSKEKISKCVKKTLFCIGGYFAAFIPAILLIFLTRGMKMYVKGISEILNMPSESSSYSLFSMLTQNIKVYISTWQYMEITIFMVILGLLIFLVLPTRFTWLRYLACTITTVGFVLLLYKKGLFDRNYNYYLSVYFFGALILMIMLVWFLVVLVHKKSTVDERTLALIGLIVIVITPLGSNNDIYSNLNNMFFVFPLFLYFVVRFVTTNEHFRGVRYSVLLLTLTFSFQSLLFGTMFTFRDGISMEKRDCKLSVATSVKGMYTTKGNAEIMEGLFECWNENNLSGKELLLYGNVSGLSYYLNEPVSISTAWPSLPSFTEEKFENEMKTLEGFIDETGSPKPILIIGSEEYCELDSPISLKQEILKNFITKYDYSKVYNCDKFTVLSAEN